MSTLDQTIPRRPDLCPYFITNGGHCPLGDQCTLLHDTQCFYGGHGIPSNASGSLTSTRTADTNDGDQYFKATFQSSFSSARATQPNHAGVTPYSETHFTTKRPISGVSACSKMTSLPSPGSVSSVRNNFGPVASGRDGLPSPMNTFARRTVIIEREQFNCTGGQELVARPATMDGKNRNSGALSHSASTPSFSTVPDIPKSNNLHRCVLPLSAGTSPAHSPGMSPDNSPRSIRRRSATLSPMDSASRSVQPQNDCSTIQENVGGTTYFYTALELAQQLQGVIAPTLSVYPGIPPHVAHMKPKNNIITYGVADDLKLSLLNKQFISLLQIDATRNPEVPIRLDDYEHLFPLEPPVPSAHHKSPTIGYPTTCYRATDTKDGMLYCLRRVHGFRLTSTKCMQVIDVWKKVQHSNICQLKEVFTTKGFGDHSIVFVYDYHPAVTTMMIQHFTPQSRTNSSTNQPQLSHKDRASPRNSNNKPDRHIPKFANLLPECLVWHYVIQLTSALRTIHAAGLGYRVLDPTKITVANKHRVYLNCCGMLDVLGFDATQNNQNTTQYQQEDMLSLGRLVLALACNSVHAVQRESLQATLDCVARNYSADLKNLIIYLLSNHNGPRSINDIMPMIGARFYVQLDASLQMNDVLENELVKELENSRLFRLISKLGVVNDRPEFNLDPSWSETGDRYIVKLFRDYLFHQVDENGAPWIDMAHMVQTLNKLDAGSPEKLCLVSRDQSTVLIVSFAEVKVCLEAAVSQLQQSSAGPTTPVSA